MSCALVVDLERTRWTRTGCGPQGFTSSRDLGIQTSHGEHKTGHHRSMARGLMKHSTGIRSTEGPEASFSTPAHLQMWGTRTRAFAPGCDEAARGTRDDTDQVSHCQRRDSEFVGDPTPVQEPIPLVWEPQTQASSWGMEPDLSASVSSKTLPPPCPDAAIIG